LNNRDSCALNPVTRLTFDWRIAIVAIVSLITSSCSTQQAAEVQKPAPPAKVDNAVKEGDLATVTLSPEAEARLGIRTAPVEFTSVTQTRTFGGEVVLPPDSTIIVSSPMAGTLLAGASGGVPAAGAMVRKGQAVFRLLPLLPPERDARALAEKDLTDAQTRVEGARLKLNRAEALLQAKAGSVKQVEQAREDLALAESALKAARAKLERVIRSLAASGEIAILLVEQYYDFARSLADQYLVMERGEIVARGAGADMDRDGVRQRLTV